MTSCNLTKTSFILGLLLVTLVGCQPSAPTLQERALPYPFDDKATQYQIALPDGNPKGTLLLMAGFGQTAQQVMQETPLVQKAAEEGLACVVLPIGYHLWLDSAFHQHLEKNLEAIRTLHNVPFEKGVVLGGFSAGGTMAMCYAELRLRFAESPSFPINGVFLVDSPLDLAALHAYCIQELEQGIYADAIQEARFIKNMLESQLGGTPKEIPEIYAEFSPYTLSPSLDNHSALFSAIPLRSYHDADEDWYQEERGRTIQETHLPVAQHLVATLRAMGNEDAEIIIATGKGYRADGTRHPHSWSIVDAEECLAWAKRCLNN